MSHEMRFIAVAVSRGASSPRGKPEGPTRRIARQDPVDHVYAARRTARIRIYAPPSAHEARPACVTAPP